MPNTPVNEEHQSTLQASVEGSTAGSVVPPPGTAHASSLFGPRSIGQEHELPGPRPQPPHETLRSLIHSDPGEPAKRASNGVKVPQDSSGANNGQEALDTNHEGQAVKSGPSIPPSLRTHSHEPDSKEDVDVFMDCVDGSTPLGDALGSSKDATEKASSASWTSDSECDSENDTVLSTGSPSSVLPQPNSARNDRNKAARAAKSSPSPTSSECSDSDESDKNETFGLDKEAHIRYLESESLNSDVENATSNGQSKKSTAKHGNDALELKVRVERPNIQITDDMELKLIGHIKYVNVEQHIIVEGVEGHLPVDTGSVLCLANRTVLGTVFEPFSNPSRTWYSVAFNQDSEIEALGVSVDTEIYCVPSLAIPVFLNTMTGIKGSDASNPDDEAVVDSDIDFSDDEAEAEYKRKKKQDKRSRGRGNGRGGSGRSGQSSIRDQAEKSEERSKRIKYDDGDDDDDEDEPYVPLTRPENLRSSRPAIPINVREGYSRGRGGPRAGGFRGRGTRGVGSYRRGHHQIQHRDSRSASEGHRPVPPFQQTAPQYGQAPSFNHHLHPQSTQPYAPYGYPAGNTGHSDMHWPHQTTNQIPHLQQHLSHLNYHQQQQQQQRQTFSQGLTPQGSVPVPPQMQMSSTPQASMAALAQAQAQAYSASMSPSMAGWPQGYSYEYLQSMPPTSTTGFSQGHSRDMPQMPNFQGQTNFQYYSPSANQHAPQQWPYGHSS